MKKSLRILSALSIVASSILFVPSASAIGTLYNGTSGDVACTSGFFTILNNEVTGNTSCTGTATIPSGVTSIGYQSFYGASGITSLTIGNSVTSIGGSAFFQATGLTSLTIPNSVTSIGGSAFNGASGITSLTIPNSVTSIGVYAFNSLTSLTSLVIPSSITSISGSSFANLSALTSLTIPNSVTSIGYEAFSNVRALATLTIPSSVTSIGTSAFAGAISLTSLVIPNSVTSLGGDAFYNANALTTLTLGNGLTVIPSGAFFGATSLTSVTIPNTVTSIENQAFQDATSLASLNLGTSLTTIADGSLFGTSGAFSGATSLTSLTIPSNVTSIGRNAFRGATALTTLTIPNGATSIGANAFLGTTSLTSYSYCGTSLTISNLSGAGLGSKTITGCAPTLAAPGAPTSVTASATGKRSATISFVAPASNGGSAITSYTATSTPGGITKTLAQALGGTFTFDDLQPNIPYAFAVTATNAMGTSVATTSNSIKTDALIRAKITSLSFVDDGNGSDRGDGIGGKIVWTGENIDAVLFTGPATAYPGPYNYGAFSSGWNGRIHNLTPETEYTVSIYAVSADGVGESKSLTFKTFPARPDMPRPADIASPQDGPPGFSKTIYWFQTIAWVTRNTSATGEYDKMMNLLKKFDALTTSVHRTYIKVPTSRVINVAAKSLTPDACSVVSTTAKVDAGLVTALSKETCTIAYTITGGSKAPFTMVKDFVFKKITK